MTARDIVMSAAGSAGDSKTYIEDVFSTYLYTGNGSTQTINNGIDLAGKGGMVWFKCRNNTNDHVLYDTARGTGNFISTNDVSGQQAVSTGVTAFNANGFSLGTFSYVNGSGNNLVSWTFREAPKFFDVVTYTGDGVAGKTINHNLGSVPGMILVKALSGASDWGVYHRSTGATGYLTLNTTAGFVTNSVAWNNTEPTATTFTVGTATGTNYAGAPYVAYLFAHDAGGFGAAGTDNVISCGSFTSNSSGVGTVNLGWEPQFVLWKSQNAVGDWNIMDTMRGFSQTTSYSLFPNTTDPELLLDPGSSTTSTGFTIKDGSSSKNYIYMAIRSGPMKTPTDATKVFKSVAYNGTLSGAGQTAAITTDIRPDMVFVKGRSGANATSAGFTWYDRLRSVTGRWLMSSNADEETGVGDIYGVALNTSNTAVLTRYSYENNFYTTTYSLNAFTRAPGFFDVVCYTGTGVARTVNHNLGVAPEFMIVKVRSTTGPEWYVYSLPTTTAKYGKLNTNSAFASSNILWNSTSPTSSVFSVSGNSGVNGSGATYVAYLFASCPGVSKVGSYTGNGTSQTINCGFTAGARFVLIKRTDSTGDWYVWDTARGIVAANDPRLSLNSTLAEVTTDDTIDPESTGFIVNQVAATNVNVSAATYIYLAIA